MRGRRAPVRRRLAQHPSLVAPGQRVHVARPTAHHRFDRRGRPSRPAGRRGTRACDPSIRSCRELPVDQLDHLTESLDDEVGASVFKHLRARVGHQQRGAHPLGTRSDDVVFDGVADEQHVRGIALARRRALPGRCGRRACTNAPTRSWSRCRPPRRAPVERPALRVARRRCSRRSVCARRGPAARWSVSRQSGRRRAASSVAAYWRSTSRIACGVVECAAERIRHRRVRTGEQLAVQVRRTGGNRPVADAHPLPVRGPQLLVGRLHADRVGDRAELREVRDAQVARAEQRVGEVEEDGAGLGVMPPPPRPGAPATSPPPPGAGSGGARSATPPPACTP